MGFWSWLHDYRPQQPEDDGFLKEFDAMMRRGDPDYDERRRIHHENVELRKRRDMLAEQEENRRLRSEIAALEQIAAADGYRAPG